MFILDTDHISLHQLGNAVLDQKFAFIEDDKLYTTIISFEEQLAGRFAFIKRANSSKKQLFGHKLLRDTLLYSCNRRVLLFDSDSQLRFQALRAAGVRIGSKDLMIASITLTNNATLITRNLRDFRQVPNLRIEDWSQPSA